MKDTAFNIATLATDLVAFSPVVLKLSEVIDDKASNADSIAKIIEQDAALSTRLLKIANSPLYGFSQEIGDISDAVSRIGTIEVYRIALSVSVSETFQGIPETLISMEDFWSHSLLCAFSAQELTTTFQVRNSGAIYAAGLLHDIGQLVLFANRPEKATEVLERCLDSYEETDQAIVEKEIFGFTHAEVGFELARMWSFPELLQECIAFHHEPESANKYRKQARLINLSNVLAIMIEIQSNDIDDAPAVDNHLRNAFGRELMDIGLVCRRIEERYIESKRIILGAMI